MTIYEIDAEIAEILNQTDENGEIPDEAFERLTQLAADRNTKIENAACMVINLTAEAKAIREQEKNLADRRQHIEKQVERIKDYVVFATDGNPFSSARVSVSYRKSTQVEVNEQEFWTGVNADAYVRQKIEIDKAAIKSALKEGIEVTGASLVEKQNLVIK